MLRPMVVARRNCRRRIRMDRHRHHDLALRLAEVTLPATLVLGAQ